MMVEVFLNDGLNDCGQLSVVDKHSLLTSTFDKIISLHDESPFPGMPVEPPTVTVMVREFVGGLERERLF